MSVLPAQKHFKLWLGVTFSYTWQYLTGNSSSSSPNDLAELTAALTLYNPTGDTVLTTYTSGVSSGHSGIFYGGLDSDPTNGLVTFLIVSGDTAAITWKSCAYTFTFTDTSSPPIVTMPLTGTFAVLGTLL
jgi:hypothetical protein